MAGGKLLVLMAFLALISICYCMECLDCRNSISRSELLELQENLRPKRSVVSYDTIIKNYQLPAHLHKLYETLRYKEKRSDLKTTIRKVDILHRHGHRSPIYFQKKDFTLWPEGIGQLTPLGMHQLFILGNLTRNRYVTELGFLAPTFSHYDVQCRASDTDRTLMSSQGFMLGLYPQNGPMYDDDGVPDDVFEYALPCKFQPVPVHTENSKTDLLLRGFQSCTHYWDLLNSLPTSEKFRQKTEENRELLDEVAKLFEVKDIKLEDFYEYVDIVMCEKAVNLNSRNVSDSLFQQMIVLNDWVVEQQFNSEFGVYVGGNLIDQVLEDFESNNTRGKLNVYSAHDTTIASLLCAMGLDVKSLPTYASYVFLELHEDESKNTYVKMIYNGDLLHLPKCNYVDDLCPLAEFSSILKKIAISSPQSFQICRIQLPGYKLVDSEENDWNSLLHGASAAEDVAVLATMIVVPMAILVLIFLVVFAFVVTHYRKQLSLSTSTPLPSSLEVEMQEVCDSLDGEPYK